MGAVFLQTVTSQHVPAGGLRSGPCSSTAHGPRFPQLRRGPPTSSLMPAWH